jgi:hypothetical protein
MLFEVLLLGEHALHGFTNRDLRQKLAGTPYPLAPEADKRPGQVTRLAQRGHRFVRYADDCNIYVGSERAGQRVMASVVKFIEGRMRLKVNMAKSAVARPEEPLDASRPRTAQRVFRQARARITGRPVAGTSSQRRHGPGHRAGIAAGSNAGAGLRD